MSVVYQTFGSPVLYGKQWLNTSVMKEVQPNLASVKEDAAARDSFNEWMVAVTWYEKNYKALQKEREANYARDLALAAPLAPLTTYTMGRRVGDVVKVFHTPAPQVVIQLENDSVSIQVAEAVLADE
jgi:hypothetical protein